MTNTIIVETIEETTIPTTEVFYVPEGRTVDDVISDYILSRKNDIMFALDVTAVEDGCFIHVTSEIMNVDTLNFNFRTALNDMAIYPMRSQEIAWFFEDIDVNLQRFTNTHLHIKSSGNYILTFSTKLNNEKIVIKLGSFGTYYCEYWKQEILVDEICVSL